MYERSVEKLLFLQICLVLPHLDRINLPSQTAVGHQNDLVLAKGKFLWLLPINV